ncbi:response regulator [Rhizobium herbae]|uniref:DNA-binding NtrC family response regulator n=1 Tax=Rhizobium herbae TaxID=508661 RepID=A0ABS4EQR8_9HYPH|nr:response regulator [Rhizobium herbae]MBP1860289.1 DNA-binding NtrC family response regulator [Rhizobium herbae]
MKWPNMSLLIVMFHLRYKIRQLALAASHEERKVNVTVSNKILILEDEPLIAIDLDYMLENAGFKTRVCVSRAEAMDWLAEQTPLVALLDIQLKDGSCTAVASLLHDRGVPFIVTSGVMKDSAPEIFSNGTWLSKPSDDDSVRNAISQAIEPLEFSETWKREA